MNRESKVKQDGKGIDGSCSTEEGKIISKGLCLLGEKRKTSWLNRMYFSDE